MAPTPDPRGSASTHGDVPYATVVTPKHPDHDDLLQPSVDEEVEFKPTWRLYSSVLVSVLHGVQYGWCISQFNYSLFNKAEECNAEPVEEGTCIIFPGHTKAQWTFVVNAWLLGGMIGALSIGKFASKYGPKKSFYLNAAIMSVGAILQVSATNIWQLVVGRLIAGLATGIASAVVSGYIGEISPPQMRSVLGVCFQISTVLPVLLTACLFFAIDEDNGYYAWRIMAGVPILLGGLFAVLAPFCVVESPPWLLLKNRRDEAEVELAKLFGKEHVSTALDWIESKRDEDGNLSSSYSDLGEEILKPLQEGHSPPLFSPELRLQLIAGLGLVIGRQVTGINSVFYYSSDLFGSAGISDDRIGTVLIDTFNVMPLAVAGKCSNKFGTKTLLVWGTAAMLLSAIGMTISLVADVSVLSIVFTATYVFAFQMSLGPFVWMVVAEVFPDTVRANAVSLCIGAHWTSNLVIGVCYPYLADVLVDWQYAPFVVIMAGFILFIWRMVPETSGRTNAQIQADFEQKRRQ